jgi:hypothetical protein
MLDAVLSPEWDYRYYSFNRRWDPEASTRMASMRNGVGDEYFILFFPDGTAAIKGFAHESPALAGGFLVPGVFEGIPGFFDGFLNEPAFSMDRATFGLWYADGRWTRSNVLSRSIVDADGSGEHLSLLVGTAADYAAFAAEYFEVEVDAEVVGRFFRHEPLTSDLAAALYEDADLDPITDELDDIGYPVGPAEP